MYQCSCFTLSDHSSPQNLTTLRLIYHMSAGLPEGVQMRGRVQDRTDLIFLEKPFEMDTLLDLIRHHLQD